MMNRALCVVLITIALSFQGGANATVSCVCRCCYRGDCYDVDGTAVELKGCQDCTATMACNGTVEMAQRMLSGATEGTPKLACLALAAAERNSAACSTTTMSGGASRSKTRCTRSTTLNARCVNRGGAFQKWSCVSWIIGVVAVLAYDLRLRYTTV